MIEPNFPTGKFDMRDRSFADHSPEFSPGDAELAGGEIFFDESVHSGGKILGFPAIGEGRSFNFGQISAACGNRAGINRPRSRK